MPNYRETSASVTKWRRANQVIISNPLDDLASSQVIFIEEDVVQDGLDKTKIQAGTIASNFNPTGSFDLLDPTDDSVVGTVTHLELYAILYSLYIATATARDAT